MHAAPGSFEETESEPSEESARLHQRNLDMLEARYNAEAERVVRDAGWEEIAEELHATLFTNDAEEAL